MGDSRSTYRSAPRIYLVVPEIYLVRSDQDDALRVGPSPMHMVRHALHWDASNDRSSKVCDAGKLTQLLGHASKRHRPIGPTNTLTGMACDRITYLRRDTCVST